MDCCFSVMLKLETLYDRCAIVVKFTEIDIGLVTNWALTEDTSFH